MKLAADQTQTAASASALASMGDQSRWAHEEKLILKRMAKLGAAAFGSAGEISAITEILHLMSELVGLNRGRVLLMDSSTGLLEIKYFYGLTKEQAWRGKFAANEGVTGHAFALGRVAIVQDIDSEPMFLTRTVERKDLPQEMVSYIALPFEIEGKVQGVLAAHRLRKRDRALVDDVDLMHMIAAWIAQVLTVNRLIASKTKQLQIENEHLRAQLQERSGNSAIVGGSAVLLSALKQVEQVASSDATVLLLGESGTGKELFAHALHSASPRVKAPFIKVNCGAIPEALFESELFGHEKGAFTGALVRRIGRIEQANGGTLFLDEIGDLPLAMQVKLLRVLQDRVVERVGGSKEIPINIRVVAATHRDLSQLVAVNQFRLDLYYRLSVIPIRLPALRERSEDIPAIVWRHLAELNHTHGKQAQLASGSIAALSQYHWPGNVRQLRNVLERLVLLADRPSSKAPLITKEQVNALLSVAVQENGVAAPERIKVNRSSNASIEDIVNAIAQAGGNKSRAAQELGLTLRQLNYSLAKSRPS